MEEYVYYGIGIAIAGAGLYGIYKKYYLDDGKITLDEVMDIVDDIGDIIDDVTDAVPSVSKLRRMKKAELVALCEKYGLDAEGIKDDLVKRLKGMQ